MSAPVHDNPYSGSRFKRSLLHFFSGKSIVAVIGVLNLLLLVRALPKDQYGIAVSLIAFFEIIQLITNFGSFAAAYRYIPELRATQRNHALFRFSVLLMVFRFITLLMSVAVIYLFAAQIAEYMAVAEWVVILQCYLLVILFEGMSRFVDVFFDSSHIIYGFFYLLQVAFTNLSIHCQPAVNSDGLSGNISTVI